MISIGIDPGKRGAMALINRDSVSVQPIPIIPGSKISRDEYNLVFIREWLLNETAEQTGNVFVTVERSQPLPPKIRGSIAQFQRGVACGWEWMLVGMSIPYQLVRPIEWQKVMFAGTPGADTKQRSIIAAQRLYPDVSLLRTERSKKPDHNLADALLIAEFGRRQWTGNLKHKT
jgi:hypothetical protein